MPYADTSSSGLTRRMRTKAIAASSPSSGGGGVPRCGGGGVPRCGGGGNASVDRYPSTLIDLRVGRQTFYNQGVNSNLTDCGCACNDISAGFSLNLVSLEQSGPCSEYQWKLTISFTLPQGASVSSIVLTGVTEPYLVNQTSLFSATVEFNADFLINVFVSATATNTCSGLSATLTSPSLVNLLC